MSKRVMKNFSISEEELLRKFIFTNPHGDVSFIYPQSLVACEELSPLMAAYSRTHIPMQDRVLKFLDQEKREQTRAILPMIPDLIEIFHNPDGSLKMSAKTAMFNKQWPLRHGHGSIKEETALFGYVENISDIVGKKITGHPLNKPQVKSTRYLSYGKVLGLSAEDIDILDLPDAEKYVEHINWLNSRYLEVSEKLTDMVFNHPDTKRIVEFLKRPENLEATVLERIEERRAVDDAYQPTPEDYEKERRKTLKELDENGLRKAIGNFVLDSSRVYLSAATKTSLGFSVDARTLEEIITDMISSPRKEDQEKGYSLWEESKKISPALLGEKSHIKVDRWKVMNEKELRQDIQERFRHVKPKIGGDEIVDVLTPRDLEMYTDKFNAALVVFPYVDNSLRVIMEEISDKDEREILKKAHKYKGEHDVLHPAIAHGGLMFELVMGYHGYRDIFRHRRGSRSNQLLTTRLGFEIPEIFKVFGLDKEYQKDMQQSAEIYEEAKQQNQHTAEKLVPFGAKCRSLYSWQLNQVGYIGRLRSNIARGNVSYVRMAREMVQKVSKIMPETARFFILDEREYPAHLWKKGYPWYDEVRNEN